MKAPDAVIAGFAPALVHWQRRDGRHGLPWQGTRDPYRVWLSEIMLQQTQVSTVLGYYQRFLQRFPDVQALATASEDEVMSLWSGLGYYSRARNLHRCARAVVSEHGGRFPSTSLQLATLPGIGDSTAAAIAAFCHGERVSIADGNVRRVLSRLLAFEGDLSQTRAQKDLWQLAQSLLPERPSADDMVAYTQGLMDLGAGVCTLRRPACDGCPVAGLCEARRAGTTDRFPVKTRRIARRHESWWLLVLRKSVAGQPAVWLERRPPRGIWAGLHCVPVAGDEAQALALAGPFAAKSRHLPALAHALTHRELRLHPVLVDLGPGAAELARAEGWWVPTAQLGDVGLPAPVRSLLMQLPG
ncbi:A/G-specific adenine glycosylase [Hydrogenophaga pseudoflava]|uniref:A/G-specific adenine glycosylase n=1 Tax=Hydrogenophaga pseudoflava TaxID=47421 RepID=UPI0027E3C07A|nr:A/G-specific adenine glycosylase [Hydrogenophaga pseudoflava]MDQ7746752.1 A/G-specific adenine glycosylase [Hydrogenophaga pseudoflava]